MARTPLFNQLKKLFNQAFTANQQNFSPSQFEDLLGDAELSRRQFLKIGVGVAAATSMGFPKSAQAYEDLTVDLRSHIFEGGWLEIPSLSSTIPVAIIGAGLAGITAAFRLIYGMQGCRKGISAGRTIVPHIFEATNRLGGRMCTIYNFRNSREFISPPTFQNNDYDYSLFSNTQFAEAGGEWFDQDNVFVKTLCEEVGIPFRSIEAQPHLLGTVYWSDGPRSGFEVAKAFQPLASEIENSIKCLLKDPENPTSERLTPSFLDPLNEAAIALDMQTLHDYLQTASERQNGKIPEWLIKLLESAYAGEFGMEADKQSALNLLTLIGVRNDEDINIFGPSDYSVRLRKGSNSLIQLLAKRLPENIVHNGFRLVNILRLRDGRYRLLFDGGTPNVVTAHQVIFACPLSVLRDDFRLSPELPLNPLHRECIQKWNYGQLGKYMAGMTQRFWKNRPAPGEKSKGCTANMITATGSQTIWETTEQQLGSNYGNSILTTLQAGESAKRPVNMIHNEFMANLDRFFPELPESIAKGSRYYDGNARWFHWSERMRNQKGAYTCALPGHYTQYFQALTTVRDGLHFCGEHMSPDYQGFMEGAARTGTYAALAVRNELGALKNPGRMIDRKGVRS